MYNIPGCIYLRSTTDDRYIKTNTSLTFCRDGKMTGVIVNRCYFHLLKPPKGQSFMRGPPEQTDGSASGSGEPLRSAAH